MLDLLSLLNRKNVVGDGTILQSSLIELSICSLMLSHRTVGSVNSMWCNLELCTVVS